MNRSDEDIERVLAALREVDPPAGMERRVLAAMAHATTQASSQPHRGRRPTVPLTLAFLRWPPSLNPRFLRWSPLLNPRFLRRPTLPLNPRFLRWTVCSAAVALVAVLFTAPNSLRKPGSDAAHRNAAPTSPNSPHPVISTEAQPGSPASASARWGGKRSGETRFSNLNPPSASPASRHAPRESSRLLALRPRSQTTTNLDLVALREMRAPSKPAPPLPLTREEKLLRRVVYKGSPEELALLNPELRARERVEGEHEVERFFDPPTPESNQ